MIVCFALRYDIKMIPLDVMSSGLDVVSNGWGIIIFSEGPKMFRFSIVKPSFSFTDVKAITIPAICSVNNSGLLWTINTVLVRKGRFYASNVEFAHTMRFQAFSDFQEDILKLFSFRISLRWLIHIINSVDKTKLSFSDLVALQT